jgi:hypothetical protein
MEFINENRTRYYGLRVGDIVSIKSVMGENIGEHTVVELIPMDNNSVLLKSPDKGTFEWVAEWCTIITKVEDIK